VDSVEQLIFRGQLSWQTVDKCVKKSG